MSAPQRVAPLTRLFVFHPTNANPGALRLPGLQEHRERRHLACPATTPNP